MWVMDWVAASSGSVQIVQSTAQQIWNNYFVAVKCSQQNTYINRHPTLFVESLQNLYNELQAEVIARQRTGTKADKIRIFVHNLSDYIGDRRLCLDAVYTIAASKIEKLGKGYFTDVVRKAWTTETDENGVEWIRTDRPKGRWHK